MNYAIKVSKLKKSYGANIVLKDIDFEVKAGEVFALLGVNGAGKTTTLECIEGLKRYDSGSVIVNGTMGIQLQSSSLPDHIRSMEAIRLFAKWNKVKVNENMLEDLGISELKNKQYLQMSTGQKRRLHLALALVSDPDIVFLDEPTAGLDVEGRISLHAQIRNLKKEGKTIILASHDMAEVESLCDRIAILSDGQIVFIGTVTELTETIGQKYIIHVKSEQGDIVMESEDVTETLLYLLGDYKQRGIAIQDIKVDRGSLEEHFINIAKH